MTIDYIPLLSGFLGAVIGASASVATIYISSHFENKRQLNKLAYEAAIEDYKLAHAQAARGGAHYRIAPLTAFIHFHVRYSNLVLKNKLTEQTLKDLKDERDALFQAQ